MRQLTTDPGLSTASGAPVVTVVTETTGLRVVWLVSAAVVWNEGFRGATAYFDPLCFQYLEVRGDNRQGEDKDRKVGEREKKGMKYIIRQYRHMSINTRTMLQPRDFNITVCGALYIHRKIPHSDNYIIGRLLTSRAIMMVKGLQHYSLQETSVGHAQLPNIQTFNTPETTKYFTSGSTSIRWHTWSNWRNEELMNNTLRKAD